jgi:glutamyl-tRNA reductase
LQASGHAAAYCEFAAFGRRQIATYLNLGSRMASKTLCAFIDRHDALRAAEVERARRLIAGGAPADAVLDQFARRLTSKFLHAPTQALNHAGPAERAELLSLLHRIYKLPAEHWLAPDVAHDSAPEMWT